ncbi:MAG: glycosyltransferase family 4 protein [Raineya sp.]|nr:glycosyltransferase family 4 protein [Raineya sp.]
MKPRIAILTVGGIGSGYFSQGVPVLMELVEHLKHNYTLSVYSLTAPNKDFKPQGFRLKAVPLSYRVSFWLRACWFFILFIKDLFFYKPQLIHAFWGYPSGFLAVILKKIFRIPVIIHLQGGDSVGIPEIGYGIFQKNNRKAKITKWAYSKANELMCLTHFQKHTLEQNGIKKTPFVIPYGVDTHIFVAPNVEKNVSNSVKIIHVADLNPVKNQSMLLLAFQEILKHIPEASLTIIGLDTLEGKIQNLAKDLGVNKHIHFLGILPRKEIVEHLQKAHILLHTSFYEAQAVVVAEAMACKTVVCGSNVGLIADLNPLYTQSVAINDYKALAEKVLWLFQNPDVYRQLQEKGFEWTQKHDFRWTVEQIKSIYTSLIFKKLS